MDPSFRWGDWLCCTASQVSAAGRWPALARADDCAGDDQHQAGDDQSDRDPAEMAVEDRYALVEVEEQTGDADDDQGEAARPPAVAAGPRGGGGRIGGLRHILVHPRLLDAILAQ